jgi:hypothetical protein
MFKRFFTLAYAEIPTDLLVFITHCVPQIWLLLEVEESTETCL